jgi:predicted small secreted protein
MRDHCKKDALWTSMLLGAIAMTGALSVSGCNTIEGVGEDIEATGDAIDDAAEDAQD